MKYIDGIKKIYYSVVKDGVHESVKVLSNDVVEFGIVPSQEVSPVFGSNEEKARLRGAKTCALTMQLNGVETSVVEEILGMIALEGGGYADTGADKPYIAIMAELTMTDNAMQYLTLYKGQMEDHETKSKTKTDKGTEIQTIQLNGSFSQMEMNGFEDGVLKTVVKSNDTGFKSADYVGESAKWGKQVILPVKKTVTP